MLSCTHRALLPGAFAIFLLAPCFAADDASASGVDLKAMDKAANPCQNFYKYACGSWIQSNPIPPDRARWSRFNELAERNQGIEKQILEKAAAGGSGRSAAEQKIGDFYGACMDVAAIDARGVKPLEPALASIRAVESKKALAGESGQLGREGARPFFNMAVQPDRKNVLVQIVSVDQGGLGLPDRDYYLKTDPKSEELRKQYQRHVQTMFELLDQAEGKDAAGAGAKAEAVLRIETALAKAALERVKRRNPDLTYHKMPLTELMALAPDFDWKQYFATVGVGSFDTLNVAVPDFFKALNATIDDTSLADLKEYLIWHQLDSNARLLPQKFQDEDFHFREQILSGVKEMQARWKQCVTATDRALGDALGQKFIEVAFSGQSKQKALQLVGEIESEMGRDIKEAAWMTPGTKDQALTKLQEVSNKIGYPEKWKDYSSVKVDRGDYFGDSKRAREFEIHRNYAKLGKPVDKSEWGMTPGTVNAYYSPPQNNINFPAGILQPPFYNPKGSDALNYGSIGVVIGHELTHGFDDQGRRFDGAGNLRDWWSPADAKNFEQRADCVAQEYSGFSPAEGVKLNGRLTLGENAADNGGIRLAYLALMDSLAKHTMATVDGFTPQQQFFLGYSQIWCENATEQSRRLLANTDPHSPGEFRVNGVLQNVPEFSQAFGCKVGDAMISTNPCRVW